MLAIQAEAPTSVDLQVTVRSLVRWHSQCPHHLKRDVEAAQRDPGFPQKRLS